MIVTGAVPEQQFSTLIPWMMEKYGKKVYTIAADYNFGQISAEWVRNIVKENGGEMVGEEFIPLGVSQFSQTIQNIQTAKPDFVVTLLVGTAQASYYEQAAAANLKLPMASSVNVGQGYEHKRFTPPSLEGHVCHRPTTSRRSIRRRARPSSRSGHAKFPNEPYINQEAANSYLAIYLYKQMVERAGSTDHDEIRRCSPRATSASTRRRARSASTPRASTCRHTIYLAHVKRRSLDQLPEGLGGHQALLAGRGRLRPDQVDPKAQYTPATRRPKS